MGSELKESQSEAKEEMVTMSVRVPQSTAERFTKLGLRGSIASQIVNRFARLKELEPKKHEVPPIIKNAAGDIIYAKSILPDSVYHINTQINGKIDTLVLNRDNVVCLVNELVDLINADYNLIKES